MHPSTSSCRQCAYIAMASKCQIHACAHASYYSEVRACRVHFNARANGSPLADATQSVMTPPKGAPIWRILMLLFPSFRSRPFPPLTRGAHLLSISLHMHSITPAWLSHLSCGSLCVLQQHREKIASALFPRPFWARYILSCSAFARCLFAYLQALAPLFLATLPDQQSERREVCSATCACMQICVYVGACTHCGLPVLTRARVHHVSRSEGADVLAGRH